jgi:hypothetical protein
MTRLSRTLLLMLALTTPAAANADNKAYCLALVAQLFVTYSDQIVFNPHRIDDVYSGFATGSNTALQIAEFKNKMSLLRKFCDEHPVKKESK